MSAPSSSGATRCECDRFPNTPRCSEQLAQERGCISGAKRHTAGHVFDGPTSDGEREQFVAASGTDECASVPRSRITSGANGYVLSGGKWWRLLPCGCCMAEVKP